MSTQTTDKSQACSTEVRSVNAEPERVNDDPGHGSNVSSGDRKQTVQRESSRKGIDRLEKCQQKASEFVTLRVLNLPPDIDVPAIESLLDIRKDFGVKAYVVVDRIANNRAIVKI